MGEKYPSNTDKSRDENYISNQPKTQVSAHVKKKGEFQKYVDFFLGDDYDSKPSFIDRAVPFVNKLTRFVDIVNLFLEPSGQRLRNPVQTNQVRQIARNVGTAYNKIADARDYIPNRSVTRSFDFSDVRFDTVADAEEAKQILIAEQEQRPRHILPCAVLYDRFGLEVPNHIYWDQGWSNLTNVRVLRTSSGDYILDLPQPEEISK